MFPSRPRSRLYSDKDDGVAALVRRGRWEKVVPYEAESSTKRGGEQRWLKKTSNLQLSPGAWRVKSGMKRWEPGWEEMSSQEDRKVPWGLSASGARSQFTQHLPAVSSLHIPLGSELVQTQARRRWRQESNLQPSRNDCCVPHNHNMPFENYHFTLGREDPLEKAMATHSSTLAWRIKKKKKKIIILFIFGCSGSSLLSKGFLSFFCHEQRLLYSCSTQASHYIGFPCCGTWRSNLSLLH